MVPVTAPVAARAAAAPTVAALAATTPAPTAGPVTAGPLLLTGRPFGSRRGFARRALSRGAVGARARRLVSH